MATKNKPVKAVVKKIAPKKGVSAKRIVAKPVAKKVASKPAAKKVAAPIKKVSPPQKAPATKKVIAKPVAKKALSVAKKAPQSNKVVPTKKVIAKKVTNQAPAKKVAVIAKSEVKPVAKKVAAKPVAAKKVKEIVVKKVIKRAPPKSIPAPKPEEKQASVKNPVKAPIPKPEVKKSIPLPKITSKNSLRYEPDFTKSVLDKNATVHTEEIVKYSDADLSDFKELIQRKLDSAKKEISYLQGLLTRKDDMGGDDGDGRYMTMEDGSLSMEREQLSQMASRQITFRDHLEKALMRIENKTYGVCRVTGKLIDKARLRAVPHATLSIEAKMGNHK